MEVLVLQKTERYKSEKSFSLLKEKPTISENDFVAFLIFHNEKLPTDAVIWLSEISFELSLITVLDGKQYVYECLRNVELEDEDEGRCTADIDLGEGSKQRVQFVKIFINNFGTCEIAIDHNIVGEKPMRIGDLEVIPSKIRPTELNNIFDFLLDQGATYWQPFSLVKSKVTDNQVQRYHLFWLLKMVQADLTILSQRLPSFRLDPRSRLTPKQQVVPWFTDVETTESSLQWLMENMSVLEKTNNTAVADILIQNRLYTISEVQAEYLHEDTDIYENQIIHGFLINVREFLSDRRIMLKYLVQKLTIEVDQTGVLHSRQLLRYYRRLFDTCTVVIQQCEAIIDFFEQYVPVSAPRIEFPTRIEGFQTKEHYYSILKPIQEWFSRDKDIHIGYKELFAGTRSIDKLYELYCLFHVINVLEKIGFKLRHQPTSIQSKEYFEESYHVGMYLFEPYREVELSLYYECLPKTYKTSIWTHGGKALRPDFVVEYKKVGSNRSNLIILDAKYQTVEAIRRFTYRALIPKYLHGISSYQGGITTIQGLFILHPESTGKPSVESWHQSPFRWFDDTPTLPAIGRVEIPTAKGAENQLDQIFQRLFLITFPELD